MNRNQSRHLWHIATVTLLGVMVALLSACSSTKHVPKDKQLLDRVKIHIEPKKTDITPTDLVNYLRQNENHRVLGGLKLQLALYNLSGHDSTKWFNRWMRRIGTAPVIYDSALTTASQRQLHTALYNRGFINNTVTTQTDIDSVHRKARVTYDITLGDPYYVSSLAYDIDDDTLRTLIFADTVNAPIHVGSRLDQNLLDSWRQSVTQYLREHGYYAFNKEHITFLADTAAGSLAVDLTFKTNPPHAFDRMGYYTRHRPFYVRSVTYVTNYDPVLMHDHYFADDTVHLDHMDIYYGTDRYLRSNVLEDCNFIEAGQPYDAEDINRTYRALSQLNILKFVNIDIRPVGEVDGKLWLDAYVLLQRDKSQTVSVELEGTNSEGDLGFGIGLNYQHRNLMHGSETLNAKFRMKYESLSGNLEGLINNNYSEYSTEVGITYPKFKAPLLSKSFKRKIHASTELALNFNYQTRPEYTRIIAGGAWRYLWNDAHQTTRHSLSLLDINYVYLPKSNDDFIAQITNPLLQDSYKNHLIMRLGYNYYRTNKRPASLVSALFQPNVYTWRVAVETAGNLLYAISKITGQHHEEDDSYKVFGIRYSQYAKVDADYALTHYFDSRQSVAFRVGMGVAIPYGNVTVLPFEKRFYAGGANSVRGWGVRTLGPGSFEAANDQSNFIYQCGDIRFDASIEYRAKVFWVIELGAFIDAGNIWTIRDYDDQKGGVFKFNKFYEQIALAYGMGIRLDFKYFLLRIDMGMKAHNPATGQEHWPMFHPDWKRDHEFHFSIGYPF